MSDWGGIVFWFVWEFGWYVGDGGMWFFVVWVL